MKVLNVFPVAALVLSCTVISFPINSAEGAGVVSGGGGGGAISSPGVGGGGGGRGGGSVASMGGAMAARGSMGAARGNIGAVRGAMAGSRNASMGNRGAFSGNRGAAIASQKAMIGNQVGFARNLGGGVRAGAVPSVGNQVATARNLVGGTQAAAVPVRRAELIAPGNAAFVGARVAPRSAVASPASVADNFQGQNFGFNPQFGGEFDGRFDRRFDGRFDDRFDRRFDRNRFDNHSVRRAIPLYYYGFNFYPSYGFNINDFSPVTVDSNGRPFNRRFVRSNEAVRVPGAILPVAGAPLTVDVQLALRSRGFYGGPIDGVIGSQSRGAIRAFQYANGLPVNGVIDSRMFTVLMRGF